MSQRPFRFLHAADFHLDRAIEGLAEAPEHLVDHLIDAPWRAAERVFNAAIDERVDFVLLAGDLIDLAGCAPGELAFLVEQFSRLAQRNILVYWAGGAVDSFEAWPARLELPPNVHYFAPGRVERKVHAAGGESICEIAGASRGNGGSPAFNRFSSKKSQHFSIALTHTNWVGGNVEELHVDYWALGGAHNRRTPADRAIFVHDPGSPQGRSPDENGPHGCTLVSVDAHCQCHMTTIATDVVRWYTPRLSISELRDRSELEAALRERTQHLLEESGGTTLLASWLLFGDGPLAGELRGGRLAADLLANLRSTFGQHSAGVWTTGVSFDLSADPPAAWLREDSIRGDFLRILDDLSEAADGNRDAGPLLPAGEIAPLVEQGCWPSDADGDRRRRVIRGARWLGADLLSPVEAVR